MRKNKKLEAVHSRSKSEAKPPPKEQQPKPTLFIQPRNKVKKQDDSKQMEFAEKLDQILKSSSYSLPKEPSKFENGMKTEEQQTEQGGKQSKKIRFDSLLNPKKVFFTAMTEKWLQQIEQKAQKRPKGIVSYAKSIEKAKNHKFRSKSLGKMDNWNRSYIKKEKEKNLERSKSKSIHRKRKNKSFVNIHKSRTELSQVKQRPRSGINISLTNSPPKKKQRFIESPSRPSKLVFPKYHLKHGFRTSKEGKLSRPEGMGYDTSLAMRSYLQVSRKNRRTKSIFKSTFQNRK